MKVKDQFASLDSGDFMFRALAAFLRGQDATSVLPLSPPVMTGVGIPVLKLLLNLPRRTRSKLVARLGVQEAVPPERLDEIDAEAVAAYVVRQYPKRTYPAIMIGSAHGALIHLAAAMGIPWLEQTFLTLARRDISPPDEMVQDIDFARRYGPLLLKNNPGIKLYQMADPANDRLMAMKAAYFRIKHVVLPRAYRQFIEQTLEPGGTIIITDCQEQRPVTQISERHFYQVGGIGGTTIDEYFNGGERVERLLEHYNSPHRRFVVPEPTLETIEAEWGWDDDLAESIEQLAAERGYRVRRLRFHRMEPLSVVAADLYRLWYEQLGRPTNQLSVESYINLEPYWALKTSSIPFWMTFNGERSLEAAAAYARDRAFDRVYLTIFSNNVESPGIPPIDEWLAALGRGRPQTKLVGVHEERFPVDFSTPFTYFFDFPKTVPARYPMPAPMPLGEFDALIRQTLVDEVEWL